MSEGSTTGQLSHHYDSGRGRIKRCGAYTKEAFKNYSGQYLVGEEEHPGAMSLSNLEGTEVFPAACGRIWGLLAQPLQESSCYFSHGVPTCSFPKENECSQEKPGALKALLHYCCCHPMAGSRIHSPDPSGSSPAFIFRAGKSRISQHFTF